MVRQQSSIEEVLPLVRNYIRKLHDDNLPIQEVRIFGSRVRGEDHRDSDIDVCIVSPKFTSRMDAVRYLWSKRDRNEILQGLEPIGYSPKGFIDEDPLVWEIKQTGIIIE